MAKKTVNLLRPMFNQDICLCVRFFHTGKMKSSTVTATKALMLEETVLQEMCNGKILETKLHRKSGPHCKPMIDCRDFFRNADSLLIAINHNTVFFIFYSSPAHLRVPLYAAATNRPGIPGKSARISITR